jgi:myo-inositol-1(or 4)-monophosphatase
MTAWADEGWSLRGLAEAVARDTGMWLADQRRHGVGATAAKSTTTDLVTWFDQEAERRIVSRLRACRPHDAIVGEEGAQHRGDSGVTWLIDPIDGTTNFVYDLGGFAVSIGVHDAQGALAGAVFVPSSGELFSAHRQGGATCDGRPIEPRPTSQLAHALVGTGFSYDPHQRHAQARRVAAMMPHIRDIRRLGAAAIDLCLVACGRLDVYFEEHLNPWDTAAGLLIATEAGCATGDFSGGPARPDEVLVTTPAVFEAMSTLLRTAP